MSAQTAFSERLLTALPSPVDARDHVVDAIYAENRVRAPPLPPVCDLRPDLMPIRDQGRTGTCAAQVCACIKEYQERRDTGYNGYFYVQFVPVAINTTQIPFMIS